MATKSKGIGRGGKRPGAGSGGPRPGAGRPSKSPSKVKSTAELLATLEPVIEAPKVKPQVKAPSKTDRTAQSVMPPSLEKTLRDVLAREMADMPEPTLDELESLAKKALSQVLVYGDKDASRVAAARMVRDWKAADAERAAEAAGVTGKKAQAAAAAHEHAAAGGKFAPPPTHRFQ